MRALSFVPPHNLPDVVFHDAHQRGIAGDLVHIFGQLTVPHQRVASKLLIVLRRKVRNRVSTAPGELTLTWFRGIPLHASEDASLSYVSELDTTPRRTRFQASQTRIQSG